jgi:glycyl-tRNA synthetase beta chain
MAFFLLEIGTEELPADFARLALPQLEDQVRKDLLRSSLSVDRLQVTSTPRRLAVLVEGLPARQADLEEEHKGPPAQQAFRDGVPTPAAVGFARRCGLPVEQLEVRETPKGPFVFGWTRKPGRATAEVLAELIPGWIWGLQGRRFMRWGEGESRFSRPLRWLVALLDEDIIPVELPGCDPPIRSGRISRGHRLVNDLVTIPSAQAYGATLAAAGVQVDREERAASIRSQLERAAAAEGAHLDLPESLFAELVDLVEDPRVMEGTINAPFLTLPPEVLSTVMRSHQRYVPLLKPDAPSDPLALSAEGKLVPRFLCVSNALAPSEATVKRGNERVLRARLADAAFFLKADQAVPSIDRRESLARVTFAEGLGSLRDRTERLEWLTDVLLEMLHLPEEVANVARRAAHLCKHDLVSQMVGEFPELQGIMGAKYLLAEGESREVALAIFEHYRPRGIGDPLPESLAGGVLAVAERFELLLSSFMRGERPSGSSDPYGLRRAGNGIVQIILQHDWRLDSLIFLQRVTKQWLELFIATGESLDDFQFAMEQFMKQRLESILEEESFNQDIIRAVISIDNDQLPRDFCEVKSRVGILQMLRNEGRLLKVQTVVQRAASLAKQAELPRTVLSPEGVVDSSLFEKKSEQEMFEIVNQLAQFVHPKCNALELLLGLEASIDKLAAFFDGPDSVLVMCDDRLRRKNRLHLLCTLRNQAEQVAHFEHITK